MYPIYVPDVLFAIAKLALPPQVSTVGTGAEDVVVDVVLVVDVVDVVVDVGAAVVVVVVVGATVVVVVVGATVVVEVLVDVVEVVG